MNYDSLRADALVGVNCFWMRSFPVLPTSTTSHFLFLLLLPVNWRQKKISQGFQNISAFKVATSTLPQYKFLYWVSWPIILQKMFPGRKVIKTQYRNTDLFLFHLFLNISSVLICANASETVNTSYMLINMYMIHWSIKVVDICIIALRFGTFFRNQ